MYNNKIILNGGLQVLSNPHTHTHTRFFPFFTVLYIHYSVSVPLANCVSYQTSLKAFSLNLYGDIKQTTKSSEHLTVCEMNK